MDALTVAVETAPAVSHLTSAFMLHPRTYARGAELGFSGLDFYVCGRGGVLGDVNADVVTAAFAFFEPTMVRTQWEMGRQVSEPLEAGRAFADCLRTWTEAKVPEDFDTTRLADLAARVVAAASPAVAPLFAGWRAAITVPDGPSAATFAMNALRELRAAHHAAAVVTSGLTMHQAVSHRSPVMSTVFGWGEPLDTAGLSADWDRAEEATNRALDPAFEVLDAGERQEFRDLSLALLAAVGDPMGAASA